MTYQQGRMDESSAVVYIIIKNWLAVSVRSRALPSGYVKIEFHSKSSLPPSQVANGARKECMT